MDYIISLYEYMEWLPVSWDEFKPFYNKNNKPFNCMGSSSIITDSERTGEGHFVACRVREYRQWILNTWGVLQLIDDAYRFHSCILRDKT